MIETSIILLESMLIGSVVTVWVLTIWILSRKEEKENKNVN